MDCMELMAEYPDKHFDLAIVDPPYGIGQDGHAGSVRVADGKQLRRVFDQKEWDKQIPPPEYFAELRRVSKNQIVWGGNYMTAHLPPSRCWVTWDKAQRDLCMADGESAWTSFDEPSRIWTKHRKVLWDEKPIHPTQKPVNLYKWLLSKWAKPGQRDARHAPWKRKYRHRLPLCTVAPDDLRNRRGLFQGGLRSHRKGDGAGHIYFPEQQRSPTGVACSGHRPVRLIEIESELVC
jgi:site-specific DNA-methyltransferase (adenine-specific)